MSRNGPPKQIRSLLVGPDGRPLDSSTSALPPSDNPAALRTGLSPRAVALSNSGPLVAPRHERRSARAKKLAALTPIANEIMARAPEGDEIAFLATFLVHATLPYKDPGGVEYWERSNGEFTVTFEPGLGPKDAHGVRRRMGLPFGIYPRLINSYLDTWAVRHRDPVVSLGNSLRSWITEGLGLNASGGVNGTITRLREQMMRMLCMKITVTRNDGRKHRFFGEDDFIGVSLVPVEGVAAFWDSTTTDERPVFKDLQLALNLRYFNVLLKSSVPLDQRIQLELARHRSCLGLDLYRFISLRQFHLESSKALAAEYHSWDTLAASLGQDNALREDFRRSAADALELLRKLYPGAMTEARRGGLVIRPGYTSVPRRPKRPLPALVAPAGASQTALPPARKVDADDAS